MTLNVSSQQTMMLSGMNASLLESQHNILWMNSCMVSVQRELFIIRMTNLALLHLILQLAVFCLLPVSDVTVC